MTDTGREFLGLELLVPEKLARGAAVTITLRIHNRTKRHLDLTLRGRAVTFDVEVARATGPVVWRMLEDEIVPAIALLRTLDPDERIELQAQWDQRTSEGRLIEPGDYAARGLLLLEGGSLGTPWSPIHIEDG